MPTTSLYYLKKAPRLTGRGAFFLSYFVAYLPSHLASRRCWSGVGLATG
jgi:hypothetical protein